MALPVQDQVKIWSIVSAVFLLVLWFLGDVLLPFIVGSALAYFLDPVADRLERAGLSRALATTTISLGAMLAFIMVFLLVIPMLIQQSVALFEAAPQLFGQLRDFLSNRFPSLITEGSPVRQALASVGETIQSRGGELLNTLLTSARSLLSIISFVVIVPVVTFYMLLDWDRMIEQIDGLLPRDHAPTIRQIAQQIDGTLSSFIRGQGTVVLILGIYYAGALMLTGLNFGLVVGAFAGLISFIPYIGALLGGALAIGLALFQFWGDWAMVAAVAAIFGIGQVVEGNYLTPKLVGNSVGLHPVWLLVALSIFGTLFGFVGMLVAVPVAAVIGVLTRFAARQYLESRLYRGLTGRDEY